jgi:membrane carboxypeptidase/penicillin-binding protein PbpC
MDTLKYLTAVWVGNNDATYESIPRFWVTGAAPIWNAIMSKVLKGHKAVWPEKPEVLIKRSVYFWTLPIQIIMPTRIGTFGKELNQQAIPPEILGLFAKEFPLLKAMLWMALLLKNTIFFQTLLQKTTA